MNAKIIQVLAHEIEELQYLLDRIKNGTMEAKLDEGKDEDFSDNYRYRAVGAVNA